MRTRHAVLSVMDVTLLPADEKALDSLAGEIVALLYVPDVLQLAVEMLTRIVDRPPRVDAGTQQPGQERRSMATLFFETSTPQIGDRPNFVGLVLGCIEAKFCK